MTQNDYYIEAKESPHGGNDLKRYRDEGDAFFYTEKVWELIGKHLGRKETEREATREEFDEALIQYPDAIALKKQRLSFAGMHEGEEISIDMDSVKFDHSPAMRYFIEAEIIAGSKEDVVEGKHFVRSFLEEVLGRTDLIESPGMFTMAFKKR